MILLPMLLPIALLQPPALEPPPVTLPIGVRVWTDAPHHMVAGAPTLVIVYALPNGSTIEQAAGRRPHSAAEWRLDSQHVAAQTRLLRTVMPEQIVVDYIEADGLSWPAWLGRGLEQDGKLRSLMNQLLGAYPGADAALIMHSGGGSVLFSLIRAGGIPAPISRVALLDAAYDFTDKYHDGDLLTAWLRANPANHLVVLSYDDRTVTINGQRITGSTGGGYRGALRLLDSLSSRLTLRSQLYLDWDITRDAGGQLSIALNRNYANIFMHAGLVSDQNGFLYSATFGTNLATAWGHLGGPRAFTRFIAPADPQLANTISPRPAKAASGSEIVARYARLGPTDRENAIRTDLEGGNLPDFLRSFRDVHVEGKDRDGSAHSLTYQVMPDYLAVGSDDDFCRMPMTFATAMAVAKRFGCSLPTRKMVDQIYQAAEVKLEPRPLVYAREAVTTFVRHNAIIEEQRRGVPLGPIVAGIQKDLVLTNRLLAQPDRVAIYGWHRLDGASIQPLSTVHRNSYVDYSHGVRLINENVVLDGKPARLSDIQGDPVLAPLVSDEGP